MSTGTHRGDARDQDQPNARSAQHRRCKGQRTAQPIERSDGMARIWEVMVFCLLQSMSVRAMENDVLHVISLEKAHLGVLTTLRGGGSLFQSNLESNATMPSRTWPFGTSETVRTARERIMQGFSKTNDDISQKAWSGRRHRPSEYRDVLDCDTRQWSWADDTQKDLSQGYVQKGRRASASSNVDHSYVDYRGKLEGTQKLSHSPVVYQYYGRSRIRGNPADSVHFILLGPNVDHWKAVGQVLASRGFNTIACERLEQAKAPGNDKTNEDAPNLVLEIMEALKWKKAIVVGCDTESILAMETAMMLSPDQVVGLVLAGDLTGANKFATAAGVGGLDTFLQRVLDCPFLIVWDGDSPTVVSGPSAHKALEANAADRCVILGGGSAPHRLKPEQFAWVLTRFVEEKLEITVRKEEPPTGQRSRPLKAGPAEQGNGAISGFLRALNLPFGINSVVSPEGRLLLGRAVAAALFYITAMRVVLIQYGILRNGLIAIKSRYESIDALTKRTFQAIGSFIFHFGYIPRLFTVKQAVDDEEDENRRSGTIVLSNPSLESEEEQASKAEAEEPKESEGTKGANSDSPAGSDPPLQDEKAVEDTEEPEEEMERPPLFKPFFFLDNVVT